MVVDVGGERYSAPQLEGVLRALPMKALPETRAGGGGSTQPHGRWSRPAAAAVAKAVAALPWRRRAGGKGSKGADGDDASGNGGGTASSAAAQALEHEVAAQLVRRLGQMDWHRAKVEQQQLGAGVGWGASRKQLAGAGLPSSSQRALATALPSPSRPASAPSSRRRLSQPAEVGDGGEAGDRPATSPRPLSAGSRRASLSQSAPPPATAVASAAIPGSTVYSGGVSTGEQHNRDGGEALQISPAAAAVPAGGSVRTLLPPLAHAPPAPPSLSAAAFPPPARSRLSAVTYGKPHDGSTSPTASPHRRQVADAAAADADVRSGSASPPGSPRATASIAADGGGSSAAAAAAARLTRMGPPPPLAVPAGANSRTSADGDAAAAASPSGGLPSSRAPAPDPVPGSSPKTTRRPASAIPSTGGSPQKPWTGAPDNQTLAGVAGHPRAAPHKAHSLPTGRASASSLDDPLVSKLHKLLDLLGHGQVQVQEPGQQQQQPAAAWAPAAAAATDAQPSTDRMRRPSSAASSASSAAAASSSRDVNFWAAPSQLRGLPPPPGFTSSSNPVYAEDAVANGQTGTAVTATAAAAVAARSGLGPDDAAEEGVPAWLVSDAAAALGSKDGGGTRAAAGLAPSPERGSSGGGEGDGAAPGGVAGGETQEKGPTPRHSSSGVAAGEDEAWGGDLAPRAPAELRRRRTSSSAGQQQQQHAEIHAGDADAGASSGLHGKLPPLPARGPAAAVGAPGRAPYPALPPLPETSTTGSPAPSTTSKQVAAVDQSAAEQEERGAVHPQVQQLLLAVVQALVRQAEALRATMRQQQEQQHALARGLQRVLLHTPRGRALMERHSELRDFATAVLQPPMGAVQGPGVEATAPAEDVLDGVLAALQQQHQPVFVLGAQPQEGAQQLAAAGRRVRRLEPHGRSRGWGARRRVHAKQQQQQQHVAMQSMSPPAQRSRVSGGTLVLQPPDARPSAAASGDVEAPPSAAVVTAAARPWSPSSLAVGTAGSSGGLFASVAAGAPAAAAAPPEEVLAALYPPSRRRVMPDRSASAAGLGAQSSGRVSPAAMEVGQAPVAQAVAVPSRHGSGAFVPPSPFGEPHLPAMPPPPPPPPRGSVDAAATALEELYPQARRARAGGSTSSEGPQRHAAQAAGAATLPPVQGWGAVPPPALPARSGSSGGASPQRELVAGSRVRGVAEEAMADPEADPAEEFMAGDLAAGARGQGAGPQGQGQGQGADLSGVLEMPSAKRRVRGGARDEE